MVNNEPWIRRLKNIIFPKYNPRVYLNGIIVLSVHRISKFSDRVANSLITAQFSLTCYFGAKSTIKRFFSHLILPVNILILDSSLKGWDKIVQHWMRLFRMKRDGELGTPSWNLLQNMSSPRTVLLLRYYLWYNNLYAIYLKTTTKQEIFIHYCIKRITHF